MSSSSVALSSHAAIIHSPASRPAPHITRRGGATSCRLTLQESLSDPCQRIIYSTMALATYAARNYVSYRVVAGSSAKARMQNASTTTTWVYVAIYRIRLLS